MRLTWQPLTLNLRNPFRLSYGVSDTRRVVRSNRRAPTCSSSLAMPTDSVGWVTFTRAAAFENEPSSATARK